MTYLMAILRRWPVVLGALIAAAIVHIATTLLLPQIYRGSAYTRLARTLPDTSFVILPLAKPREQVLPFQIPDARHAICRFSLREGPVAVRAFLPEPGWTLSAYGQSGESFYALPASEQRRLAINLLILPPGDRFLGAVNDARNFDADTSQVTAPETRGLIVISAPLKGRTYASQVEHVLAQSACRKHKF